MAEAPFNDVRQPSRTVAGGVLPPRDLIVTPSRPDYVRIPIAVHVRRVDRFGRSESPRDEMLRRMHRAAMDRLVLPPADRVAHFARPQDIDIPIAVQVRCVDRARATKVSVNGALGPGATVAGRVFKPEDVVVTLGRSEDVEISVGIHVFGVHRGRNTDTCGPRRAQSRYRTRHLCRCKDRCFPTR